MGTTMNLQIEDTCQNFPTPPPPQNPNIENFKPPKILQLSLSLEIRSTRWELKLRVVIYMYPQSWPPTKFALLNLHAWQKRLGFGLLSIVPRAQPSLKLGQ